MRFRDILKNIKEQEELEKPQATSQPQQQPVQQPVQEPTKVVYADRNQLANLKQFLTQQLPSGNFELESTTPIKKIRHIRAKKVSTLEVQNAMAAFGAEISSPDETQNLLSGKYPVNSFVKDNVIYSIVVGVSRGAKGEAGIGLTRKELTPVGLGLAGQDFTKTELIDRVKQALSTKIRDEGLKLALLALVDNAAAGGQQPIDPELAKEIKPLIGIISQDLGEILAPIMLMDESDTANFPAGNEPLIDVRLKNVGYSIKALTGSGTSFASVSDLMTRYEQDLVDEKEKSRFNVLKQFHPSLPGKNVDKLIRAAKAANIPEYQKIIEILGIPPNVGLEDFNDLVNKLKPIVAQLDYPSFLKMFYPAMVASQRMDKFKKVRPAGLPADGSYYLGFKDKPPKREKAAGKNHYNNKPIFGGADILTYVLGTGLLNYIRESDESANYEKMISDILNKSDAVISHITIKADGTMSLYTKPFSNMKFAFQYHAPSHIPGNNLPGFIHIPD